MTHRSNHLRRTYAPRHAARAVASQLLQPRALGRLALAIATSVIITVLVLITGPISAEYGFV